MSAIDPVPELDTSAMDAARRRWATRAKPPGSLGRLEDLAVHLAGATGVCPPSVPERPAIAVFAGDHGVATAGASAWPQEITAAMVHTIATGGAAINAFANSIGASVTVVDVGVATPLGDELAILRHRVRRGTANIAEQPAMSTSEAADAVEVGAAVADNLIDGGADCLIGGEMGIGNTTPSAALIAVCAGRDAGPLVGPGAGDPAADLGDKVRLVRAALDRAGRPEDAVDLLAQLGGLEIAALAGYYVAAARRNVPFIVDGVIACAALCVADRLAPGTARHAIAGHRSTEPAAAAALDHLGLRPLLDLDLRLGEGSGAAVAFPLLAAAARALGDMATLPNSS